MKPIYHYCKNCTGTCCYKYHHTQFLDKELISLAYHFKLSIAALKKKFKFYRNPNDSTTYNLKANPCPFFFSDKTKKCTIYGIRPTTCRKFPIFHFDDHVTLKGMGFCKYAVDLRDEIIKKTGRKPVGWD
jgi:Fe-S-cluster containining protein